MKYSLARVAGLAAATAVAVSLVQAPPAVADVDSAADAGAWLAGQRGDDGLLPGQFGPDYPDVGMTIDLGLGLYETGRSAKVVRAIGRALDGSVSAYAGSYSYDDGGDTIAAYPSNATAKATVGAYVTGQDPTDVDGLDLVSQLEYLVADGGADAGRLSDRATKNGEPDPTNDYANVIGQSFAARGLAAVGSDEAAAARDFLLSQQCDDGSFLFSSTTPSEVAAACDADEPSVDAVSIAALNLMAVPGKKAATAVDGVVGWLRGEQKANGSFGGAAPTTSSNANTTGLAGWVLGEAGARKPARKAARWVAKLQLVNAKGCRAFDADDLGAIAYDAAARDAAAADGITDATGDQFRRTTAQAFPVLQWAPAARPTGPCS